jgi:zinc transport system ATP-binding protein
MVSPASEKKELISVKDVNFDYDGIKVLKDINFSIQKGDFLALIGPNGSGKTTLIKVILGLLKPAHGRIFIDGHSIQKFHEWRKIGYVPQNATHFDPYFPASVKEVVAMGLLSSKPFARLTAKEEDLIEKSLELVEMEKLINQRIGNLSGGQQQRVFIARAIVNSPEVIFLDEPTTGIDKRTQEMFYDMLAHLNKDKGITIVLITHEIGIINKHITKVACLNQRLVYHGSHKEFCRSDAFKDMLDNGHHLISHRH